MGSNIIIMYNRGTLAQFNIWHEAAMASEEIVLPNGKVGYINGIEAPTNQRTIAYSEAIPHPINNDDYIWDCGSYPSDIELTIDDVKSLGWMLGEII